MNRTSVSHENSRPTRGTPVPRGVVAREAGLELIRRINRWLLAAAVAAAGVFSLLAAHAFHGRTVTTGAAATNSSAASSAGSSSGVRQSTPSAGGSGLQAPAQAPTSAPATPAPVVSGGS